MDAREFIARSDLDSPTVNAWIAAEWLVPIAGRNTAHFSDVDLARVRLIKDLKADFGVNDEGMAIILHLLDQLHGLRCLLRDIQAVIQAMGPLNRAKDVD
jgi:chaperone modulatory protein CbpM